MNPQRQRYAQHPDREIRARAFARRHPPSRCLFRFSAALGLCVTLAATLTANGRDILRPGSASVPSAQGIATGSSNGAVATQARANALDAMARTTRAIQSVQAMQTAARNAAIAGPNNLGRNPNNPLVQLPDVTNGLGANGLVPAGTAGSSLWQGAKDPAQSTSGGQTTVNIQQTSQQAVLSWNKFNVGKQTTLNFDQSAGGANTSQWIAFNKVTDPSGVPSQILGSIKAQGQVYVINQNGIIFGGSSQVNTHALVASSLPINDNLINRGLLNNPDSQFLFSSLPQASGKNGTPAFTPPAAPNGKSGDVTVQPGAVLSSPTTADHTGGRVALIGPNVTNAGTVSTPDGQTILAAGQQVGLAAHSTQDASLRGLDVYVGMVDGTSGVATNSGIIETPRGNISLAGKSVNHLGVLDSSTSVAFNGRIDLSASYGAVSNPAYDPVGNPGAPPFLFGGSGTVTFGPGSATQILPEWSSSETVVGTKLALPSVINTQGQAIYAAPDSTILSPSGTVTFSAGLWSLTGGSQPLSRFVYSGGQIYMDSNSLINVAGSTDILVPVSQNIVSVQLRGTELANSPLQRESALRGQTIQVDIGVTGTYDGTSWVGTPLADASGYVGLIQRTVGQLTTTGGAVTLNAGGSVIMQTGSRIDVSGGWKDYQGGLVQTTRLMSGGHIYDVAQATPDLVYDGIYTGQFTATHPKWGQTFTYSNSLALTGAHYVNSYLQGGDGGTVSITAPGMALDGTLLGLTVAGERQLRNSTNASRLPATSGLSFIFLSQDATTFNFYSPTPPEIIVATEGSQPAAGAFELDGSGNPLPLRNERLGTVFVSPNLTSTHGFGKVLIDDSDGNVTVPASTNWSAPAQGSIIIKGANVDIEGRISAPGGTLQISVYDITPNLRVLPPDGTPPPSLDPTRGRFTLGGGGVLNAAGWVLDDRVGSIAANSVPVTIGGGTVNISSYSLVLAEGSSVDASGGVLLTAKGKAVYGDAGAISLRGGQDPLYPTINGGTVQLGGTLTGFSGATGGALSVQASLIQIGGSTTSAGTLLLQPEFFNQGGFGSFSLTGLGAPGSGTDKYIPAIEITPGTVIEPVTQSWLLMPLHNGTNALGLTPFTKPVGERTAASLNFVAAGVKDSTKTLSLAIRGDFVMGQGAAIVTDPKGSVKIAADTVTIDGRIVTPGGSIAISSKSSTGSTGIFQDQSQVLPTLDLGPAAFLSAAGTTVLTVNPRGYRTGSVIDGGTISITGNIVAQAGSRLDVSGSSDVLYYSPTYTATTNQAVGSFAGARMVAKRVDGNAGSISLKGLQELFSDATLVASPGGPSATGGTLTVSSGFLNLTSGTTPSPLDVTLRVTQSGPVIPVPFGQNESAIGKPVLDSQGKALPALGHIAVAGFASGRFDSVNLLGTVGFSGPVAITANRSLVVGDSGVIFADANVRLSAPYVSVGKPFIPPLSPLQPVISLFTDSLGAAFYPAPTYGNGNIVVTGTLIDIGTLSLQNTGQANFIADNGDIRGNGTLDVKGTIYMRAGQIYPPTESSFTVNAYDYNVGSVTQPGSVTIAGSGTRQLPLSAGGALNIYASMVNQGGVLRAPIGTINLGWNGTGTGPLDLITNAAVPVSQKIALLSGSQTSVSAVDPVAGQSLIIPYGIYQNGANWIDPSGTNITSGGAPSKSITISAANVAFQSGASIDLRGGGDLSAYNWIPGTGGTNDILASNSSFAIIPGYQAAYAPYAPYATSGNFTSVNPLTGANVTDPGYVNGKLKVGDQVYLGASSGLPAGTYTLLPARYALLSGAFLVTPLSSNPVGSQAVPDGSSLVSGFRFNGLGVSQTAQPLTTRFEVAPSSVVNARSQYQYVYAGNVLGQAASASGNTGQRLPVDGGQLVLNATQALTVSGFVNAGAASGGRGGLVDISTPADILITGPGGSGASGVTVLDSTVLSALNAGSILIGGVRQAGANGDTVMVSTNNITVDNAGSPFTGSDIILVANNSLTVKADSQISASGTLTSPAESLTLGNAAAPGSGNGTLLRVSSDPTAGISRVGVDSTKSQPKVTIGAINGDGVRISGTSIILDSTSKTDLAANVSLIGQSITLDSGQISLQLNNAPALQTSNGGLVLAGTALQSVQSAQTLSLLSYSSIDIYGTGSVGSAASSNIQLHASDIRGFMLPGGGTASFTAQTILLDNSASAALPAPVDPTKYVPDTLAFNAGTLLLGANQLNIERYPTVALNAGNGIVFQATGGLATQGALTITTPSIIGVRGSGETITAVNALAVLPPSGGMAAAVGGLGTDLTLQGASVTVNSTISLPSGVLTLHATGGDVSIGGTLDVSGTAQSFFDLVKYTDGGQINLTSDTGSVKVLAGGTITVAANPGAGNAGTLAVSAPQGTFSAAAGTLFGKGGAGGQNGSFSLDASTVGISGNPGVNTLTGLEQSLNEQLLTIHASDAGYFTQSQNIRIRGGGVTNNDVSVSVTDPTAANPMLPVPVVAHSFALSADQGSIQVSGTMDASGATGGTIILAAHGSATLLPGSTLTVVGANFDAAGKGGAISLEAGTTYKGVAPSTGGTRDATGRFASGVAVVDIQSGSTIQLGVLSLNNSTGTVDPAKLAAAAGLGQFTGTLHLRAPQTTSSTDVQMDPINGTISNASSVVIEGYKLIPPAAGGALNSTVLASINSNGKTFAGLPGVVPAANSSYSKMVTSLFGSAVLPANTSIVPGAEIIGTGNLTLGTVVSTATSDWDFSTLRFGPDSAPGFLTLRAIGNIVLYNAISDGFTSSAYNAPLLTQNLLLPANAQSWSYRIVAGADLTAADFQRAIASGASGSLQIGKNGVGAPSSGNNGTKALTSDAVKNRIQVIRTGSGDITISTGGSVQLLNQFATIYTAGTQITSPTMGGTFDVPVQASISSSAQGTLGATQESPTYPAQYTLAGGNVTIMALGDIKHQTFSQGVLVDDSEMQLPINWLYRRGYVDASGNFGKSFFKDVASTTWWVDFSNFFEGVGALGGGNVTLVAGGDVKNVDGVIPTNARMPGKDASGNPIPPNQNALLELGGGNLTVHTGHDINGGVYYVERGTGTLFAGNSITTNSLRSPSVPRTINVNAVPLDSNTWLPITLFLGKGGFDVSAARDVLLGPVANPFLLPAGISNTFYYKTYFSTYAADDFVNVSSLGGNLTLREEVTLPGNTAAVPTLLAWLSQVSLLRSNTVSLSEPWLRLADDAVNNIFNTVTGLLPSTLRATAFAGDLDIAGSLVLSPSARGTIDLAAYGSIHAVQPNGLITIPGTTTQVAVWDSSRINLSDASPAAIPGVTTPSANQTYQGTSSGSARQTSPFVLSALTNLFNESGSTTGTYGVLQTKQALHGQGLLHEGDAVPIHLYAENGDISGLTLFSPKAARVIAGTDITDVALYIQNDSSGDVTLVSAGRNIIAFDPNSALLNAARQAGNATSGTLNGSSMGGAQAGDIQISGLGTLMVLTGGDLRLGLGAANVDGTGVGISSIGNGRNPNLPFAGAAVTVGAGLGSAATGLAGSNLDFSAFDSLFLNPDTAGTQAARYLPTLGTMLGLGGASNADIWTAFNKLPAEQKVAEALDIFYLVLRDAGRDHNDSTTSGFGNYNAGYQAIAALFPGTWNGRITLDSRSVQTLSGGDISIFAPGGGLSLGTLVLSPPPGVVTQAGGNISIFTQGDVNVGTERIFTLRGGDEIIWSSNGSIAAGSSSKTVQSAPPTRVLIDPQSGDVKTDLAGLATGGGIGVLAAVAGVPAGNVDLIAPKGTIDAGDAGIRSTGKLNVAATVILNASNIQASGGSSGTPTTTVSAPNLGSLSAGNTQAAATSSSGDPSRQPTQSAPTPKEEPPSVITVEVLGYGGGEGNPEDPNDPRKKKNNQE